MKRFSCAAIVFCCLALLQSGQSCPEEKHCCDGRSGGTSAPSQWPNSQSPAGGPSGNLNAAVCYFYRSNNCLICKKGWSTSKCCTQEPSVSDDTQFGGPTPYNEYLIGERYTHRYGIDWYNLYPRKESENGYYGYYDRTATGRYAMGLHPGTISQGCVTVTDDNCWEDTRSVLDSGHMTYRGSDYSGFLYVL